MLYLAAVLIFATGVAHSYLGERYLLARLFKRQDLPKLLGSSAFTIGTLRFAWHLTTVAWWAMAGLVVLVALPGFRPQMVLQVIALASLVSALFPLYFTRGKHLSWIVFMLVAALLGASAAALAAA